MMLGLTLYVAMLAGAFHIGRWFERREAVRRLQGYSWSCPDCHVRFRASDQWIVDNFADNHIRAHLGINS